MRRYELMLLLRPDLEDDKLQAAVEKVTRAIVNGGGSLSKVSPWGKRRLAYSIGNFREASYFLIHFDIEPAQVREIERGMLISEEILRHLVTLIEDRGPAPQEEVPAVEQRAGDMVAEPDTRTVGMQPEAAPPEVVAEGSQADTGPGEPATEETEPADEKPAEERAAAG
ncbi:MAG: 30S ribosomal protein S6 [Candidatus Limnocylindria bacterium]